MTADRFIADAEARRRALAPEQSFIVKAPAGSGKTALLTQRYLRLLAVVDHPEEIVAITFTRKAASEMRNRILDALDKAGGPRPEVANDAFTWELARTALARDRAKGWNLLANPQRLRIGTIDSFCTALTRQMPMLSRLGAPPKIVEDAEALYREAARGLIAQFESGEEAFPPIRRLLDHLDNDLPKIEDLIGKMLERRDQWMRHLGSGGQTPQREALEAALSHVIEDRLAALHAAVPKAAAPEIVELVRYAAQNLSDAGRTGDIRACLDLARLPGARVDDLPAWRGIASLLTVSSSNSGGWRRRLDTTVGFPPGGTRAEKARCTAAKDRFVGLVATLAAADGLLGHLFSVHRLPSSHYTDDQWEVIEALCRLLPRAVAQLDLVFKRRGEVDFTEVSWSALRALGTPDEPTDLALNLDYRVRHLLVDEFQDTSLSQYELLELLTAGWVAGDGRTLFMVGDPMQSIYRFRQAEVGLFLRAWHEGIGGIRLEPLTLEVNFRSHQGIVDWVNETFSKVLSADDDVSTGAVKYSPAAAHHTVRHAPSVAVHPMIGQDDAGEAEKVIDLIREAMSDPAQRTIAVLVRARGHLFEIAPRLRREGLQFRAVEIETLGHRAVVQDLLVLTRALVHPGDRLSWLALLRGPMCGLTLADLEALAGGEERSVIWETVHDAARVDRLSADGRLRVERLRGVLAEAIDHRRRRPLRRLVEGTWLALGGPACARDTTDLADAMAYLDLIEQMEVGGDLVDLEALSGRVEELFALPDLDAGPRLQLMTIHKAKGLEFDTVIIPGLGRGKPADEQKLLALVERTRAGKTDLLLAPIRQTGADSDPVAAYLKRFEAEKDRHEDGRVLYVAATRAIGRLHLLGHVGVKQNDQGRELRDPPRNSLLNHLWPAVKERFEREFTIAANGQTPRMKAVAAAPQSLLRRLPAAWRLPSLPQAAAWSGASVVAEAARPPEVEFEWAREVIRRVGTVVHGYLLHFGREGGNAWDERRVKALRPQLVARLREEGVPAAELERAESLAETALLRTLADGRGQWILDATHAEAHGEYAISGFVGGNLENVVLDRTFVDEAGVRWIVDYKTSAHEGGDLQAFLARERERYAPQLERYAALMRGVDSRRPIRVGLYFPLLGGWVEWAPETC